MLNFFSENREILIAILVKIGIVASLASLLTRSQGFRKILFLESRSIREKLLFISFWSFPLCVGVIIRISGTSQGQINPFAAFDLSFEGTFIAGLLGGNLIGAIVGSLLGLVALLYWEWGALPLYVALGLFSGMLRNLCHKKEEIWNFSPFVFLNLIGSLRSKNLLRKSSWQLIFFFSSIGFELLRQVFGQVLNLQTLFYFPANNLIILILILVASVCSIGVTLKIWNNTRLELKVAEQGLMVVKARLDALANQINPHFLFNTLNSISSLIRTDPRKARAIVIKLSHILRKLLRGHDNFIPLKEELEFIDNYLDIEVIRFGNDKLRIEKKIQSGVLAYMIPSMVLQPIIENSIKHGILPKIEGGEIKISAVQNKEMICIRIEDNGLGMSSEKLKSIFHSGIGVSNIVERLKIAYQSEFAFTVNSIPGQGTVTKIEIPLRKS